MKRTIASVVTGTLNLRNVSRQRHVVKCAYTTTSATRDNSKLKSKNASEGSMDFKSDQSFGQLIRTVFVLQMCSLKFVSENSHKLLGVGRKLVGRTAFDWFLRKSFYGHFVAGDSELAIESTYEKADKAGIKLMGFLPVEECPDNDKLSEWIRDNETAAMNGLEITARNHKQSNNPEIFETKLTPFVNFEICHKLSRVIDSKNRDDVILWLSDLLEQTTNTEDRFGLNKLEVEELEESLKIVGRLCQYASENNITIILDAEYTWINPALSVINHVMMKKFNSNSLVVMFTYQANLKSTRAELLRDIEMCRRLNINNGFKLVRGAYVVAETEAAKQENRPNPLCESFEATNENYNNILRSLISSSDEKLHVIFASHNLNSVELVCHQLDERKSNLGSKHSHIYFAQSYGMCDFIADTLAKKGHVVYKNVPYGSIDETLPYLHRRVQENSFVFSGWHRERKIILQELRKRMTLR